LTGGSVDCGPADQRFEFLPAASVADGFAHLCDADVLGAFNIGTGVGKTLRELSERIAAVVRQATGESRGEIRFGMRENSGPQSLVPSAKKIIATGWEPPESLEVALKRYVEAAG
jgi:nucleoside-diphosphate-sugar epimerase